MSPKGGNESVAPCRRGRRGRAASLVGSSGVGPAGEDRLPAALEALDAAAPGWRPEEVEAGRPTRRRPERAPVVLRVARLLPAAA